MPIDTYIRVADTIKPVDDRDFPIVESKYVSMPDGGRLSTIGDKISEIEEQLLNVSVVPEVIEATAEGTVDILPDKYYSFGEVLSLSVNLLEVDDGCVHEYCFEFIPASGFAGLFITPSPSWACERQYTAGYTCQVSILRGIAVMLCA